jgi:6 kDa early secretory antigenic target
MSVNDGDIFVNYGQVNDVEDVLRDASNSVSMIVDEVQSAVAPLVASWLGQSQDTYSQVQAKWNADMGDMQSVLTKYAPTLEQMKVNYGNNDNNLALQWSAIPGS